MQICFNSETAQLLSNAFDHLVVQNRFGLRSSGIECKIFEVCITIASTPVLSLFSTKGASSVKNNDGGISKNQTKVEFSLKLHFYLSKNAFASVYFSFIYYIKKQTKKLFDQLRIFHCLEDVKHAPVNHCIVSFGFKSE